MSMNIERGTLRRYLLGASSEAERASIDRALLEDDRIYQLLLAAEDELLDECAEGALGEAESQRFVRYLSQLPDRQGELTVARTLSQRSRRESEVKARTPRTSPWSAGHYRRALALAAAVLVTLGASFVTMYVVGLVGELDLKSLEIARLTTASPPVFVLQSGIFRGPGGRENLVGASSAPRVELLLDLPADDHVSYQAILHDADASELLSRTRLSTRSTPSAIYLPLVFASTALPPGDYFVVVSGVTSDGESEPVARYDFRVR